MSYILEALKKSDQQRQRGVTPTLQAAQLTVVAPKQPMYIHYGVLAAILLAAGITIGWLRPWQTEHPVPATKSGAVESLIPLSQQNVPAAFAEPPEMSKMAAQEWSAANATPAAQRVPGVDATPLEITASASTATPSAVAPMPQKSTGNAVATQEQRAVPLTELPLPIQQEIPALAIQLHAYASNPAERLVSINSRRLREGEFLTPGLKLEQITPDGVIFSYKGYLFQRGIR